MPSPTLISLGFEHRIVVSLAELAVSNNPGAVLTAYSLGSCLGVAIYDPAAGVGGLLHAMLPDSTIDPAKAVAHPAMFLDTGLRLLLQEACDMRADRRRLRIYVIGGAQVMDENVFNIGSRNCAALTQLLRKENLQVDAQQIGGNVNRTISLCVQTGRVTLKVSGFPNEISLC